MEADPPTKTSEVKNKAKQEGIKIKKKKKKKKNFLMTNIQLLSEQRILAKRKSING